MGKGKSFGHSPHSAYWRIRKQSPNHHGGLKAGDKTAEFFLTHLMRVGSMGHSGFTNWVNKKEKKTNAPLKQDTQSPYKSVPIHMCKHWSSPDQGIDFMRYQ